MEELATIDTQFDEELNFEYRNNSPIEYANNTNEGADAAGVEMETPGIEIDLENPGVEVGKLVIRTIGVENPNKN